MKIIEPGHVYELDNVDGEGKQTLRFVRRRGQTAELLDDDDREEGILTQEVLRALIDRTIYLHAEQAWHENVDIVNHLREALRLYESRAAHRHLDKLGMPERMETCEICGHIFCFCYRTEEK